MTPEDHKRRNREVRVQHVALRVIRGVVEKDPRRKVAEAFFLAEAFVDEAQRRWEQMPPVSE